MKNSHKTLITMIICIGWGLGTTSLAIFAGNWLGEGKGFNFIGIICMISNGFTIRICRSFDLFSYPVILMVQFLVYVIIGSIISFVVTRKGKVNNPSIMPPSLKK